jgi:chaperonin GroES
LAASQPFSHSLPTPAARIMHARSVALRPSPFEESFMSLSPLHDRVLLRRIEAEGKTAGGIIIPDTAKEKPQEGEIVAVGPGARDESGKLQPLDVKVGDRVLFGKWSGSEVKLDGEELIIMKETDILGILDKKAAAKKAA